ncbi:MAG: hypothetical protein Q9219_007491, partial [cf. Caloplaca sp. 3 TL-2023]
PTPTCFQPRQSSDPVETAIDVVLASAIPKACDPQLEEKVTYLSNSIRTYHFDSYNFNISQDAANDVSPAVAECTKAFQSIVSTCVDDASGSGSWGGWFVSGALNYSISDFEYPKNALLSVTSAFGSPTITSAAGDVGSLSSGEINTAASLASTGAIASRTDLTGLKLSGVFTNAPSGTTNMGASNTGSGPEEPELPTGLPGTAFGSGQVGSDSIRETASNGVQVSPSQGILSGGPTGILDTATNGGTTGGTGTAAPLTGSGGPTGAPSIISGDPQDSTAPGDSGAGSGTEPIPSNTFVQTGSSFAGAATGQSGTGTGTGNTGSIIPTGVPSGSGPVTTGLVGTGTGIGINTGIGTGSGTNIGTAINSGTGSALEIASGSLTGSSNSAFSGDVTGISTGTGENPFSSGSNPSALQGSTALSGITSGFTNAPNSGQATGGTLGTNAPSGRSSGAPVSQDTNAVSNTDVAGPSNQNPSGEPDPTTQGGHEPQTTKPGNGPITAPPAIPTTPIDRGSPQATSNGIVIGGLLFGLSKSAKDLSNDITIPATKTAFLHDIEVTENQLETLFKDMGGTLPPEKGGCGGGGRKGKRGIGGLVGDIFNTVRCAINSVDTLKGHIDVPEPDIPTIEGDLDDVGSLAENIDENDENDDDDDDSSTKDQDSTKEEQTEDQTTNEPSTNEATTNEESSRASSTQQPSSASASTTGTASSTGDTCGGCCPTEEPLLPTEGTPAVTAAPTDFNPIDRRAVAPGRLRRLVKRAPAKPIPKINGCNLQTPSNWDVTIPAYPGGFEFYESDTQGNLGTLTTISRYYRSTTTGAPACTPTITQIDAAQWTFSQSGNVPENDKISVDHAYEIGFLKSFMESLIDKPSGISCNDANKQFFDTGSCPDNRMEPIFGSLPSIPNPDFVAMSQWLNGDAKGFVLGPDYRPELGGATLPGNKVRANDNWKAAMDKIKNKMKFAQILVEAALIINADNTIATMQKTNNRIYAAMKTHDTYLSQHAGLPQARFGWAAKYKTYMDNWVNYRNGASARLLGPLLTNVAGDLRVANNNVRGKVQAEIDPWTNLHGAMTSYYTGSGAGVSELNWAINWEWNTGGVKREEFGNAIFKRQACSRPTGTQENTGDATGTATGFDGGDGSTKNPDDSATAIKPEASFTATDEESEATSDKPDATSTNPPTPTKTSAPESKSCQQDSDCSDFKCSSGDPFCAIAISKRENACIALGTCPGSTDSEDDDSDTTTLPPAATIDAPESFPTGFCGCKNQDPAPSKTENTPTTTQPPAEGCTDGGLYGNFDECSDHCAQGMCQENAGQPQITCACN